MSTHHSQSLRASMHDGVSHAVMLGSAETYLSALAIFLGASTIQIGLLAALPPLFAAVFQLVGVWCVDRSMSRRRVTTGAAALQGGILFPMALLPLLSTDVNKGSLLVALAALYYALAGLGTPIWSSLVGDLVPMERRGRFFGVRARRCGLATGASIVIAGGFLEIFRSEGNPALGFTIIFLGACAARLISSYWLSKHDDPPYSVDLSQRFTFIEFMRRIRHSNFARYVLFTGVLNFGIFFAAPFFSVYMLSALKLPYVQFTLLVSVATLSQFLTLGRWGEISDLFGNRRIMTFCATLLCITPALWLVSSNLWYLCAVQLVSGVASAGLNLATANFLFDAVTPPKRARCVAYQSLVNGVFIFSGAMLGGYASRHVSFDFSSNPWLDAPTSPLLMIFLISALIRSLGVSFFIPLFKEVREVQAIRNRSLMFRVVHIRPFIGMTLGIIGGRDKNGPPRDDQIF